MSEMMIGRQLVQEMAWRCQATRHYLTNCDQIPCCHIALLGLKATFNAYPLDKMAAISQTVFSDEFSWMKRFEFWLKFHWQFSLRVQLTITQRWFR